MTEVQQSLQRGEHGKHSDGKKSGFRDDKFLGCDEGKALSKLRNKYSDDRMVAEKFAEYRNDLERIKKKAYKFKEAYYNKYGTFEVSQKKMSKARKLAKKYNFTDEEFECFFRYALADNRLNTTNKLNVPNTEMSRTLGYTHITAIGDRLKYKDEEKPHLDTIMNTYDASRVLHEHVKLQTITYDDVSAQAITGDFIHGKHDPFSFIHPVVAALFLPKVNYLEEIMLLSNIGNIVKRKRDGLQLDNKADYALYWAMITDPNDLACEHMRNSALKDLDSRYKVQVKLWETVLALRQGYYYDQKLIDFLQAIDRCPNNLFDAPDFSYVRDEGTLLRKILGVFSLRPTVVTVTPTQGGHLSGFTPLASVHQVTSIPMMTVYLPPKYSNGAPQQARRSFDAHLSQPRWFIQNKMIVPKTISIVFSRDVFFVYVPRRFYNMDFTKYNNPFNFSCLPVTISGAEKHNDCEFDFEWTITLSDTVFNLRSVVFVETAPTLNNVIVGTSAGIVALRDAARDRHTPEYFMYNPQAVNSIAYSDKNKYYERINPTYRIDRDQDVTDRVGNQDASFPSFCSKAQKNGTIFMYASEGSDKSILPCAK
jgi:hypothetical protein